MVYGKNTPERGRGGTDPRTKWRGRETRGTVSVLLGAWDRGVDTLPHLLGGDGWSIRPLFH